MAIIPDGCLSGRHDTRSWIQLYLHVSNSFRYTVKIRGWRVVKLVYVLVNAWTDTWTLLYFQCWRMPEPSDAVWFPRVDAYLGCPCPGDDGPHTHRPWRVTASTGRTWTIVYLERIIYSGQCVYILLLCFDFLVAVALITSSESKWYIYIMKEKY